MFSCPLGHKINATEKIIIFEINDVKVISSSLFYHIPTELSC